MVQAREVSQWIRELAKVTRVAICSGNHRFPYFPGSSWAQRIDGVNLLVPGQLLSAPYPNHIVLNTESGEARWETSSQEWIPEDGL
jgi:hypothetical protein